MKLDLKLEIKPYQGVAGVEFGMTSDQVRAILDNTVQTFKKSTTDTLETDYFEAVGMQVFYKQPGVCEAIELAAPAKPTLQGKDLLGRSFRELCTWFQSLDHSVTLDETGLTSPRFGIGLYAPFSETAPDKPVEGVIVFEQGYYDL